MRDDTFKIFTLIGISVISIFIIVVGMKAKNNLAERLQVIEPKLSLMEQENSDLKTKIKLQKDIIFSLEERVKLSDKNNMYLKKDLESYDSKVRDEIFRIGGDIESVKNEDILKAYNNIMSNSENLSKENKVFILCIKAGVIYERLQGYKDGLEFARKVINKEENE